jgi:hypothetical protein
MKASILLVSLFAAPALMMPLQAQQAVQTIPDPRDLHHEVVDDAYKPNAWNNQRTTPAYRFSQRMKSGLNRSSIYTAQVNVNAQGMNIVGDAGNEPSIAVDPNHPERIVIGWRQFDNVSSNFRQAGWSYSLDGGQTWTFPGVINPGVFRSDPVLDYDSRGNFYYNSLEGPTSFLCKVYKSTDGGATWDDGVDAQGGDKQWMAIDRSGEASDGFTYAFWSYFYSTCDPGFATRSTDGEHYENCFTIDGYPYWGTMAVGSEGELYVAGTTMANDDSLVVARSLSARFADSLVSWDQVVKVFIDGNPAGWKPINPVGLLGQVNVDVDHSDGPGSGNVYITAPVARSSSTDPCDAMFARSTDGGKTWSAPVRINDDASTTNWQWFPTMSVAPNGRIDVIWLDTRDAPAGSDSSALYYSFSTDQGQTWSPNERMSEKFDQHVGYPDQNKMGDYFDMVSDNHGAHLAWANTFNGEEDVCYSYIVPYINTGMPDAALVNRIRVYPNPARDILTIRGLTAGSAVELYSILGGKVFERTLAGPDVEIDLSGEAPGIYFLKMVDPGGTTIIRKIARE